MHALPPTGSEAGDQTRKTPTTTYTNLHKDLRLNRKFTQSAFIRLRKSPQAELTTPYGLRTVSHIRRKPSGASALSISDRSSAYLNCRNQYTYCSRSNSLPPGFGSAETTPHPAGKRKSAHLPEGENERDGIFSVRHRCQSGSLVSCKPAIPKLSCVINVQGNPRHPPPA